MNESTCFEPPAFFRNATRIAQNSSFSLIRNFLFSFQKFRDPIEEFRAVLKQFDLASEEDLDLSAGEVVDAARVDLELAVSERPPAIEELFNDVYADYLNTPVRGKTSWIRVYGRQSERVRLMRHHPKDKEEMHPK